MDKTRLENWSVQGDRYQAPECAQPCLVGKVYNHPKSDRHPDGKKIRTSFIKKIEGKVITTYSGTVYCLGKPDSKYLQWIKNNNIKFDPENPIRKK